MRATLGEGAGTAMLSRWKGNRQTDSTKGRARLSICTPQAVFSTCRKRTHLRVCTACTELARMATTGDPAVLISSVN